MKKLLLFFIIAVVGKVAFDRFMIHNSAAKVDENMTKIAAELNQKLPMTQDQLRLERVEYSDRTLRYQAATLQGTELSAEAKAAMQQNLRAGYCNSNAQAIKKLGVAVEYAVRKDGIANINDKVRNETWSVKLRPQDCA